MLSYAFTSLNQSFFDDVAIEEFEDFHNLLAAILAKGIGQQLKHGLFREYLNKREDIMVMRGRVDIPSTLNKKITRQRILSCDFDELSENNLLNQILKTTVIILLRFSNVKSVYKDTLKKEMLFFSSIDIIDPDSIRWAGIRFRRNNQTYQMLISICQLILEGMLMTTEAGEYRLASFLDEQRMCRLYEKFLLEYYIKKFPSLSVNASEIRWALDNGEDTLLPAMHSDITLSSGNEVLIIDAKYYSHTTREHYDVHTLHSANLYQIFTYVKNRDSCFGQENHKVSGILLYAKTDESIQPDNTYYMSGNKISVQTLDLNRDFFEISQQLNTLVKNNFIKFRG